ncbi:hypothetical protein JL722_2158 [Aureococcus anophagefferens]|nr:hypothetical protein JL722_2158 [Aureococcus anophagefferens]
MKRAIKDLQDFNGKGATEQAPLPPRRQRVKTNRLSDEKPAPPPPRKRKAPTKKEQPAHAKAQSSSPVLLKKRRQPEERRRRDELSAGHQGPQGPGQDRGVVTDGCREKGDLVDVLLDARVYLPRARGAGSPPPLNRAAAEPASDDDDDELQWNDKDSSDDDEPWAANGDGSEESAPREVTQPSSLPSPAEEDEASTDGISFEAFDAFVAAGPGSDAGSDAESDGDATTEHAAATPEAASEEQPEAAAPEGAPSAAAASEEQPEAATSEAAASEAAASEEQPEAATSEAAASRPPRRSSRRPRRRRSSRKRRGTSTRRTRRSSRRTWTPRRWRRRARRRRPRALGGDGPRPDAQLAETMRRPGDYDLAAMEAQAAELRTKALGLAFLAAEARGGAASTTTSSARRRTSRSWRGARPRARSLAEAVVAGSGAFARASAFRKLADEVWRHGGGARSIEAAENCLAGHKVCFTGVFETIGRNRPDTQGHIRELTARFGGICRDGVTSSTTVLVVGRGEKGEGGHRDGKGESPTTSSKYRNALKENEKRGKKEAAEQRSFDEQAAKIAAKKARKPYEKRKYPAVKILYEDEYLAWIATLDGAPAAPAAPPVDERTPTAAPKQQPSLDEIRYTPRTGAMHGRGEVGAGALADALAAPKGFTLDNALVASGEQLDGIFAHTMLQRCACADGAGGKHDDDDGAAMEYCESYVTVQWSGAGGVYDERGGDASDGDEVASQRAHRGQSKWLAAGAKPAFSTTTGKKFEAARVITSDSLDSVCKARRKPKLGAQYGLLADTKLGMGQAHQKFFLLRFRSTDDDGARGVVRLVVSSGNCAAVTAAPSRQLVGLWWADFEEKSDPRPSAFRDALLHHARALVDSRTPTKHDKDRERALERCEALFAACARADFAAADDADVRLVSSVPGFHARDAALGEDGVRCLRRAAAARRRRRRAVCHSFGGFGARRAASGSGGSVGPWRRTAAPWPCFGPSATTASSSTSSGDRRGQTASDRSRLVKTLMGQSSLACLRAPRDERARGNKFVWNPHLMLYVLHDGRGAVRRALLTSANLSAAAWGRRRSANDPENADACDAAGALEIRSFELGVCVPVAPDAGEGFPFVFPEQLGRLPLPLRDVN